jgi:RecB family exonuclease
VPDSAQARSFVADAIRWRSAGAEELLLRLIRSSCSGVPHDTSAAYATIGSRTGSLLDAIDRGLLALPPPEREAVLRFAERARKVRALPETLSGETLSRAIAETFEFSRAGGERETRSRNGLEFELPEAAPPEAAAGAPGWQRHFSASALNTYAECARKWFYRYACAAIEDPGSAASAYGSAFHLALEDFHGDFPRPQREDEAAMRGRIRECITWAFERNRGGFDKPVEFELQVRRAQRTAQRYVDWLMACVQAAPFEVIGREVPISLDLDGHPFVGYIDRLDRDERSGGVGVVDYKTGSIAASVQEYREQLRSFEDFQLAFYYWARTAIGDRVTRLVLIPLKSALLDVRPIVLDVVPATIAELERARSRMSELADELASGTIARFDETADPAACTFCAYARACAFKPPAQPVRFGR